MLSAFAVLRITRILRAVRTLRLLTFTSGLRNVAEALVRPAVRLDRVRLDQVRSDRVRFDRVRSDCVRSDCVRSDHVSFDRVRFDGIEAELCLVPGSCAGVCAGLPRQVVAVKPALKNFNLTACADAAGDGGEAGAHKIMLWSMVLWFGLVLWFMRGR